MSEPTSICIIGSSKRRKVAICTVTCGDEYLYVLLFDSLALAGWDDWGMTGSMRARLLLCNLRLSEAFATDFFDTQSIYRFQNYWQYPADDLARPIGQPGSSI